MRSILAYKHDEDKVRAGCVYISARGALTLTSASQIRQLDSHKACAAAGPQADCVQFVEYVQRNVALQEHRTGLKASTKAIASYVRTELATALRKNPYQVNLLIGGYDKDFGASLYLLDYLGSLQKMNYGAHGYAGYFIFSTMDRYWKAGMSEGEALELARRCMKELQTRFIINQPNWTVKIVNAEGCKVVAM